MNRPKLSATMTPKPSALRFQSMTDDTAGADQADDAEAAERHVFPGSAERFGDHVTSAASVTHSIGKMASRDEY